MKKVSKGYEKSFYKEGKLEGKLQVFNNDDQIREEQNYANGMLEGPKTVYSQSGIVLGVFHYSKNQ